MDMETFRRKALEYLPDLSASAMGSPEAMRLTYLSLCLAGESGEFAEKVKKLYRDADGRMDAERRRAMLLELGDVLWTLACLAESLGSSLEEVADMCMEKYESRRRRGTLHGSGDER